MGEEVVGEVASGLGSGRGGRERGQPGKKMNGGRGQAVCTSSAMSTRVLGKRVGPHHMHAHIQSI